MDESVVKDKYHISLEVKYRTGTKMEYHDILICRGKAPVVGDFLKKFSATFHVPLELKEISPIVLMSQGFTSDVMEIKIVRLSRDHTYNPCSETFGCDGQWRSKRPSTVRNA